MDELERTLRDVFADERLDVRLRPGAVRVVHDGVRRRRHAQRTTTVAAALGTALVIAAATTMAGGLSHPLGLNPGEDRQRPSSAVSPPGTVNKPPVVDPSAEHIGWVDRPYDATHPPAIPGTAPLDGTPDCTQTQLDVEATEFQGATGAAAGSVRVTNQGAACGLQGVPAVIGYTADNTAVTLQRTVDPFQVRPWFVLGRGATATALVAIYGDNSQCLGPLSRFEITVAAGFNPTSATARWMGGTTVQPRCGTTSHGLDHYDVDVAEWRPASGALPRLPSAVSGAQQQVQQTVMQGTTLHYRVLLDHAAQTTRPCLPFRERLVGADGGVVAEEEHLLPCRLIRAAPSDSVLLDVELDVPGTASPGDATLAWDTPLGFHNRGTPVAVRVIAAPPQCQQPQLALTVGKTAVAAGSYYSAITFTNTSNQDCSLRGYPGVEFAGPHEQRVPTDATWVTGVKPQTVVLRAGTGTASFLVSGSDFAPPAGAKPCASTSGLRVIAPDLALQVLVPHVASNCRHGRIRVWPVVAGTNPQP